MGPVIGGAITQELGWRWIFWFLVIVISFTAIIMLLFFPETQRSIVGNGSARFRGIYWSFLSLLQKKGTHAVTDITRPKRRWPNPFACLPILADKSSLAVIFIYAVTYSVKMTLQTSLGAQCVEIYKLDYLSAGLIYLPSGVAGGIGSFGTGMKTLSLRHTRVSNHEAGKFLNWNYRRTADKLRASNDEDGRCPDELNFPLERTRLRGIYFLIAISALGTVGYGLALMTKTVCRRQPVTHTVRR